MASLAAYTLRVSARALPRRTVPAAARAITQVDARRFNSTEAPAATTSAQSEPAGATEDGKPVVPTKKQVKLTAETYKSNRARKYKYLTARGVAALSAICPAISIHNGATADDLEAYNTDWMRKYSGQSQLVLKPRTTKEVSEILRYCDANTLAVVPQGGNTGLVGGSVPVFDEIVVNLSNLNNIRSFDPVSGVLVADAGVILETADNYLRERGHIFPLDLGAKGSCHIGGNVATNAGGLRLLRYGSLHGNVLGLEVVLPDGRILDDLTVLRKNNTGYDLKQLFIGSEGTLGIITGVSILCPQKPASTNVAFFAVESYEKVQEAFKKAKSQLSEILSAFEMMDNNSQVLVQLATQKKRPLTTESPFYVLIETSGSNAEHDSEKLTALLEDLMTTETVLDGTLAESESQARDLWAWREGIAEALGHHGGVYKYDVSIPINKLYSLVDAVRDRLREANLLSADPHNPDNVVVDVVGYGHMGDSNLHLNVAVTQYDKRVEELLEPFVYQWIEGVRGSISAEHGLGFAKRTFVKYSRGQLELSLMRAVKDVFDPNGILNPYKYIGAVSRKDREENRMRGKETGRRSSMRMNKINGNWGSGEDVETKVLEGGLRVTRVKLSNPKGKRGDMMQAEKGAQEEVLLGQGGEGKDEQVDAPSRMSTGTGEEPAQAQQEVLLGQGGEGKDKKVDEPSRMSEA